MRTGCVVVWYHGYGGREFLTERLAFPVAMGNVMAFAHKVADVLTELESSPAALGRRVEDASRFIAEKYSPEQEKRDLVATWSEFGSRTI
jgi:hypothetical protein